MEQCPNSLPKKGNDSEDLDQELGGSPGRAPLTDKQRPNGYSPSMFGYIDPLSDGVVQTLSNN